MRVRKLISWLLVLSPAILLGWIAVSARLTKIGSTDLIKDPVNYTQVLESYIPLIRASEAFTSAFHRETYHESTRAALELQPILSEQRETPIALKFGYAADSDARRPIARAIERLRSQFADLVNYADAQGDYEREANLLYELVDANLTLRFADCTTNMRSTNFARVSLARLARIANHLPPSQLEQLTFQLLDIEKRPSQIEQLLHRDLELFVEHNNRFAGNWRLSDANQIASQAIRILKYSESIQPLIDRIENWRPGDERNTLISVLLSWQMTVAAEIKFQQKIRETIVALRSTALIKEGVDPRTISYLGLPPRIFRDPSTGTMAELQFGEKSASLRFSPPRKLSLIAQH